MRIPPSVERVDDRTRHSPLAWSAAVACLVAAVFMLSCFRVAAPPVETVLGGLVVGAASFFSLCVGHWLAGDLVRQSERWRAGRGVASAGAARGHRPGAV